jgi:hypothetical protein
MLIFDKMLVSGLRFVLNQLLATVEHELDNDEVLKERLLDAQMKLDEGELDADEFAEIEADVMARLREIRQRREELEVGDPDVAVVGVAVDAPDVAGTARPRRKKPRKKR